MKGIAATSCTGRTVAASAAGGIVAYTTKNLKAVLKWSDLSFYVPIPVFPQKNLLILIGVLAHKFRHGISLNKEQNECAMDVLSVNTEFSRQNASSCCLF